MTILPNQIHRELSGQISGDVLTGLPLRAIYSTAACIYRIMPLAIVRPRNAEDTATVVRYAADRGIPITPRGGGSGVAGHSIGPGIVLDFSAHMNRIIEEGPDWIEVEPGIILDKLNEHLARRGMRFSPDPSSGAYCTLGGMIANNSSGARGIRYGATRQYVLALEIVDSEGIARRTDSSNAWVAGKRSELKKIIAAHRADIEAHRPRVTKNSSGYELWDLGADAEPDIAHIITGSEGTLAVVTSARLKIVLIPTNRGAALLHFPDIHTATGAVPALRQDNPSAIEIMDEAFLRIVREGRRDLRSTLPAEGATLLLVEHEADSADELGERLNRTVNSARAGGAIMMDTSMDADGVRRIWEVRKAGSPIISSIRGPKRPLRFVEDMVVPPERIADFAGRFMEILRRYDCSAPIIGHAGDGNIHVNPWLDMHDPSFKTTLRRVADEVYSLVDRFGGSLSGEHGDGRLRAPYLKDHYGPGVYSAFGEVKNLFDPKGIFNPGVILGVSEITDNLRYTASSRTVGAIGQSPLRENQQVRDAVLYCHGCGDCRDDCPGFKAVGGEEFSPRARVNLMRAILNEEIPLEPALSDPSAQNAITACLNCMRCVAGCSSGVDIPLLASFLKGHLPKSTGVRLRDSILSNPRKAFFIMSRMSSIADPIMKIPGIQKILSLAGSLNPDRPMPSIEAPSLKIRARENTLNLNVADVIYFPGCYATFVDPAGVGMATLFILEKLGLRPTIATFGCCGMPAFASGDVETARAILRTTVEELRRAPNVPIITSCPSCARMLTGGIFKEASGELDSISRRVQSAEKFLDDKIGSRDNLAPINQRVAIQIPCHQREQGEIAAVKSLLERIPGLDVVSLPDACCGMGGTAGMKIEGREMNRAIGDELFATLKNSRADLVLSSCGSCRIALGTVTEDMHPLSLIAQAMGFKG